MAARTHERRTPVTVIRGSLEALSDHVVEDPAKIDEYHQQMLTESIHLERMINDLLELSRLQNPDYQKEMSSLNFVDVVENAIRSVRYIARGKKGSRFDFLKRAAGVHDDGGLYPAAADAACRDGECRQIFSRKE